MAGTGGVGGGWGVVVSCLPETLSPAPTWTASRPGKAGPFASGALTPPPLADAWYARNSLLPSRFRQKAPRQQWCPLFRCRWRPGELVRISQLQASHVDDLLGVAPEMRNAIEDRRRPGHVESLNTTDFGKLSGTNASQHPLRFLDDGFKAAHQLLFPDRPPVGTLGRTIANV